MKSRFAVLCVLYLSLVGCMDKPNLEIKIGINPWPGYEFLYLAEKKGFFKKVGLNIKLLQLVSLADSQRAYVNGKTDGLASTIIEAVQAEALGGKPLQVVMVPDYSNGGDVILTSRSNMAMADLKGKVIGAEVSSLGIFVLERALRKAGLSLAHVTLVNVEQAQGEAALLDGRIDAFVTYPPVSISVLKHEKFHKVFGSDEIPKEIVDTVSLSKEVIAANPGIVKKLRKAWQLALDYVEAHPDEAYQLMATREGITAEEFKNVLTDLVILNAKEQEALFSDGTSLAKSAVSVCQTLVHVKAINVDCSGYAKLIYRDEN
ncbi:nitrate ABC transporter [Gammaproteobacteria bacterium 45_16_T64]|nr:nitrate ABC transporter [Gammaproteobacteria bacterium 45_16_T64]